ncbi:MAG: bifunctional nuclease domain-containing protein, partial [bacterium]
MVTEAAVEMFVGGLVLDPATQAPIVVLKDESGQITLPIWIGIAEATSIASAIKQVAMARPLTHDLFYDLLLELGITVQRVVITELKDSTYFSELVLGQGDKVLILDARPSDAIAESWMRIDLDRDYLQADNGASTKRLLQVLEDVRAATADWLQMRAKAEEIAASLDAHPPATLPVAEVKEGSELLRWLTRDNLTFLGYREYVLATVDGHEVLVPVAGTGLGILSGEPEAGSGSASAVELPIAVRKKARENRLLVLTKANSRSTVHRNVFLDYFGVKVFDESGQVTGEKRSLGLLTSAALTESIVAIPVLR